MIYPPPVQRFELAGNVCIESPRGDFHLLDGERELTYLVDYERCKVRLNPHPLTS